jgi:TonB family protein
MPDWMRALTLAGLLCLPIAHGFCQEDRGIPVHRARVNPISSLAHYRQGEAYLQEDNLQSAANEYRESLNGNLDPTWTVVWSHIQLGRIFDATGQHDRAINEYSQAQKTRDNTDGALDEANNYLQHAGQAIYLPPPQLRTLIGHPIQKIEPEYTDEARLAELEGTVTLIGWIDEVGVAKNLEVKEPIGLGLDEKAMEAVKQWHFAPANPDPLRNLATQIQVGFRLSTKQSRWHLIGVQFDTPAGVNRPTFGSVLYPIGAGIGPEAMEEGRVLVAIGRLATAKLTFDIDDHGVPTHFRTPNASEPVWGSEATGIVGQWRFMPGTKNGIAVPVTCTVELIWGERELSDSTLEQWRSSMNVQ